MLLTIVLYREKKIRRQKNAIAAISNIYVKSGRASLIITVSDFGNVIFIASAVGLMITLSDLEILYSRAQLCSRVRIPTLF